MLGAAADLAIEFIRLQWEDLARRPRGKVHAGDALSWMRTDAYLALARRPRPERACHCAIASSCNVSGDGIPS
jgi:hypothetical protein